MSTIPASSARDEALEMPSRWVHALDNSQWEALRALMTDDFAYRYADGAHPERTWFSGADESIRRLQAIADGVEAVQHYLANPLLDISEDHATVAVYDLAFIAPRGITEGQQVRTVGGVWTFGLRRVDDRWLIESLLSEQAIQSPWLEDLSSYPPRGPRQAEDPDSAR
jgi:hypothetical protein